MSNDEKSAVIAVQVIEVLRSKSGFIDWWNEIAGIDKLTILSDIEAVVTLGIEVL